MYYILKLNVIFEVSSVIIKRQLLKLNKNVKRHYQMSTSNIYLKFEHQMLISNVNVKLTYLLFTCSAPTVPFSVITWTYFSS